MTLSYTTETYTSGPLSTTTEYKLSDGSRWVRIVEEYIAPDMKARKRTRVLRSDFPGDTEHRDTLTNLQGAIANADVTMYVEPSTAPVKLDTAAVTGSVEEAAPATEGPEEEFVPAFVIVPGYEEQAHPMSRRQEVVLLGISRELELTAPMEVLPPLEKLGDVVASLGDEGSRVAIVVDCEGFLSQVQVRYSVAGIVGWADLNSGSRSDLYDRVKDAARLARRTVKPEDNTLLPQ